MFNKNQTRNQAGIRYTNERRKKMTGREHVANPHDPKYDSNEEMKKLMLNAFGTCDPLAAKMGVSKISISYQIESKIDWGYSKTVYCLSLAGRFQLYRRKNKINIQNPFINQ